MHDDSGECVVIDAGFQSENEWRICADYIDKNKLRPVLAIHTHAHIDHMLGASYLIENFNLGYRLHKDSQYFIDRAVEYASVFGIQLKKVYPPVSFINDSEVLTFGQTAFRAIHTPGHADGSLCFYFEKESLIVTGDVLFKDSIGRTDLPTGNFDVLMKSIHKLFNELPPETKVYPGHGPITSLGYEQMHNPFI